MTQRLTQTLGYPRIGRDRELKKALEAFWKGKVGEAELGEAHAEVQRQAMEAQAGIDRVGVGDSTLYDHVLDWTFWLGLIPKRFQDYEGIDQYFAMARGADGLPALDLTKWYDTNYHYLVPEIESGFEPRGDFDGYLLQIKTAQEHLGKRAVPIVLGPVTLLTLAELEVGLGDALDAILPLYVDLFHALAELGVPEVQLHEPRLVLGNADELRAEYETSLAALSAVGLPINLVTYFDDLGESFPWVVQLPVATISLDFTRGGTLSLIEEHGWPEGLELGAGVIDGRNVWKIRPRELVGVLKGLSDIDKVRVGPSSSLQFLPHSASREDHLPEPVRGVLAFAEEKLVDLAALGDGETDFRAASEAWAEFAEYSAGEPEVRERLRQLESGAFHRETGYGERRAHQIKLPRFPLTSIGSFPQTSEVRRLRGRFKRGEIGEAEYQAGVDAWIAYTIGAQEALGMDVLVHGEFERSDMVEFFAEKMSGFAFTTHGWVQSYGNRYVRPPIVWGDVRRKSAMTVREYATAQSFTRKPVKGMLTGPVTIINWSFVRTDVPRSEVAFQVALALREEIDDLEAAGARIIQVDEPALREGLPLKPERWDDYLDWAVKAFQLTTGGVEDSTQIHTHMCYAEFGDIYGAIDSLNADVILIENTRSGDETLHELADYGYEREVGPGVYDVHSANVPEVEQVKVRLRAFASAFRPEQVWVNPDCGLKTRNWEEVLPALGNMAEAARQIREETEKELEPA